jgi:hypothetical protein
VKQQVKQQPQPQRMATQQPRRPLGGCHCQPSWSSPQPQLPRCTT